MSSVKVLHVLEALEGGTARHVVDLVRHAHGVEHVVAVPAARRFGVTDTRARNAMETAGARLYTLDMRRSPVHPVNAVALAALVRIVARERPEVIHGHSSIGGALARLLPTRRTTVYTPNGLAPGRGARMIERGLATRTAMLVLVSESERDLARQLHLAGATRMTVIPNGIEVDSEPAPVDLHSQLGLDPSIPLVGSVARLGWQKAPEHFVKMCLALASDAPTAHFVLIGDGPQASEVDVLARPLGSRFHRLEVLPGAAGAMRSLSAFVLLSRFEGGPYAPLEAARAGVPLVLSDVVGNRDVLVPGESGLLVPPGDVEKAAGAVRRLLADPTWAGQLTQAMTARLRALFDVRQQGVAHSRLYERLANVNRSL